MPVRFPPGSHPGPQGVYVICDVCGRKVRRSETQLIRDKWNFQNGLVVCKDDVDNVNLQVLPYKHKEKIVTAPKTLRSEPTDSYRTPDTDDRTPSAPQKLEARGATLGDDIELFWRGPLNPGTSQITGYLIERQSPQGGIWSVVSSNTQSGNTYYLDTAATTSGNYVYRIAAINGAGTGAYSNEFYFPGVDRPTDYTYIGLNGGTSILATGQGDDILLSPDV